MLLLNTERIKRLCLGNDGCSLTFSGALNLIWRQAQRETCGCFFESRPCIDGIGIWVNSASLHLRRGFMMPLTAINWYIVEPLHTARAVTGLFPSADGKHWSPLLCSWRGVFHHELFGTLLKRVALMYSGLIQWLWHQSYHPPILTHTALFLRREGKHVWVALFPGTFPCLSKRGIDGPDGRLQRAT